MMRVRMKSEPRLSRTVNTFMSGAVNVKAATTRTLVCPSWTMVNVLLVA